MRIKKLFTILMVSAFSAFGLVAPAQANTTPNSYTPVGQSWINVDESLKVYLEDFNLGNQDDTNIFFVEPGVTCVINGVTALGPMLVGDDYSTDPDASNCSKNGSAFDPIDTSGSNRIGAHPIGFTINFFGTNYTDLYFSENGGVWFDKPTSDYDDSLAELAVENETSLIAPLAVDFYYDQDETSIWTAQTTIDGKQAYIISWQDLDECCDSNTPDDNSASFQFVFINDGSGDFTAYFNYDDFDNIDQGYDPEFMVDMRNGVTIGSNVVEATTVAGLRDGICEAVSDSTIGSGSLTDSAWDNNANFAKLESASSKTVSIWTDENCTSPNNITSLQDVVNDGIAYVYFEISNLSGFESAAVGWATFNPTTQAISVTEIFANEDIATLYNAGSKELISFSLNTTVPGRLVLGQVGGVTAGDPNDPNSAQLAGASSPVQDVPYYGPRGLIVDSRGLARGTANATGMNLDTVTTVAVDGILTTFRLNSDGTLTFEIPDLPVGRYQVTFFVQINNVNLVSTIEITGRAAPAQSEEKVLNAGTFDRYVAVYAKGYAGSTLTWKIAGKWFKTELTENYQVFQRPTIYRNFAINVELYIDGERLFQKNVLTK